ncbi:phosphatidylinositol-specific phospholipase C1-like protein [Caulobacter segnis]|uniref:phosphatidylinositol-specific phospholipase C1-like protein n=1 Tax=Caulobacter segnis TaxID=88688 RepID=UPI00241028CC|nr:phosphatidylinositol-specific phospholipase C1-like protein [Caulobacter segnis]MDG2520207.1 phosphatidylinositol-specific phospholipase C1-like protein [Caulobacter segnis]
MLAFLLAASAASAISCTPASTEDACVRGRMEQGLKLNDLVAVGTHNSYKQHLPPAELAAMVAAGGQRALGIDYGHLPLTQQLDGGARQLEIDVARDPAGGLYAHPKTALGKEETLSPAVAAVMARPGYKVLHMQDVDFRSTCLTFVACLGEVRAWSKANPTHAPILIMINAKEGGPNLPGGVVAPAYDAKAFDALDAEIRSVFSEAELITPDQVQGKKATLRDAVLAGGWPTLGAARGKVFFALDESPEKVAVYRGGRRSLEGRAMFVNTDETSPAAAYLTLNDPIAEQARIKAAVKAGFVVRTRADADTWEARANDPRRRNAAFASGAQYISTDYMRPDPRFAGGYFVRLPDGAAAACNALRTDDRCRGQPIEAVNVDARSLVR